MEAFAKLSQKLSAGERAEIATRFARTWQTEDLMLRNQIRLLRDWIVPKKRPDAENRRVGGLTLQRLANIRSVYEIVKAYGNRPEPDDLRKNIPEKGSRLEGIGSKILQAHERLRGQRARQLTSRIMAGALGIGIRRTADKRIVMSRQHPMAHAIVIRYLDRYRPDQSLTRAENRRIMMWSAAKLRDYLKEGCELYGLNLISVSPEYTSRQDSRTGQPGIICREVPVSFFIREYSPYWKRSCKAVDAMRRGDDSAENRYLSALHSSWNPKSATWTDSKGVWIFGDEGRWKSVSGRDIGRKENLAPHPVLISDPGGQIFLSPTSRIHADLNAAAGIGLRALMDPDFQAGWWYVLVEGKTLKPVAARYKGSVAFPKPVKALKTADERDGSDSRRELVNLWRNAGGDTWQRTGTYWDAVKEEMYEKIGQGKV